MTPGDELHDELGRLIDRCGRDGEDTIRRTLARLPVGIRDFALDRCIFASVGSERAAQVLPPSDRWLVLFTDEPSVAESVIAHEIAYAWLGHLGPGSGINDDAQERHMRALVADDRHVRALVRSWGFSGFGADEPKGPPGWGTKS
jgi:hypothetical protein